MTLNKLTSEQALALIPPEEKGCSVNWNGKQNCWYVFRWLGTTYDATIKRGRDKRESVGVIRDGKFSYSKLYSAKKRLGQTPFNKLASVEISESVAKIKDSRDTNKVVYPMPVVLTVMVLAGLAGYTSAVSIATYWRQHRFILSQIIKDFPQRDITHDTVNRLLRSIDPKEFEGLIDALTAPVFVDGIRLIHADGQCARATRKQGRTTGRYCFNVYDSSTGVVLTHRLVDEKENEISAAMEVFKTLDIEGAVVTVDAINTQRKFAQLLVEKKANYCMALKGNQEIFHDQVINTLARSARIKTYDSGYDKAHGRIERRLVRVAPASLLSQKEKQNWAGLENGTLIEVCSETETVRTYGAPTERTSETRYFISSITYEQDDIAELLAQIIRRHWSVETTLHWTLDMAYDQDRIQCKDSHYLNNRLTLNKISFNRIEKIKKILAKEGMGKVSTKTVQQLCSDPCGALELIQKANKN